MAILTHLLLYPIKSCAGIAVRSAVVNESGLCALGVHDREWMLVTEDGQFLTQREHPRMALITPTLTATTLAVRAPGLPPLDIPLAQPDPSTPTLRTQVWDDTVLAADGGDEAAAWFSQAVGAPCRLVRFHAQAERLVSTRWTGGVQATTMFSDGYPILVVGAGSLDEPCRGAVAAGRSPIPMNRFRPNLVIAGIEAFEEDYAESFQIGDAMLKPVKPCPRCPMPSIDQATGEFGPDPLDIMQSYRAKPELEGALCFGMNSILISGADQRVRVGQEIEVTLAF